jgi:hypothetical protein
MTLPVAWRRSRISRAAPATRAEHAYARATSISVIRLRLGTVKHAGTKGAVIMEYDAVGRYSKYLVVDRHISESARDLLSTIGGNDALRAARYLRRTLGGGRLATEGSRATSASTRGRGRDCLLCRCHAVWRRDRAKGLPHVVIPPRGGVRTDTLRAGGGRGSLRCGWFLGEYGVRRTPFHERRRYRRGLHTR